MQNELPDGVEFRPMDRPDIDAILEIIKAHDEDDFIFAKKTFRRSVEGYFVLDIRGHVFGVTGGRYIDGTENSFLLSWTYLHHEYRDVGLGTQLVQAMIDELVEQEARKIFVNTSDYVHPTQGQIYQAACKVYENVGFKLEVKHPNYYAVNESQISMGVRIQEAIYPSEIELDEREAIIVDVDEIPETDDAYVIQWEAADGAGTNFDQIQDAIKQVEKWQGRSIFIGIPSDMPAVERQFISCRFRQEGALSDFYADGIHENHFRYDIL